MKVSLQLVITKACHAVSYFAEIPYSGAKFEKNMT